MGEHPHKTFEVGDVVAVPATKPDPFWLAKVTEVGEEGNLKLQYYSSRKPPAGQKRTWPLLQPKAVGSSGEVKSIDVLVRFRKETDVFTKQKNLRRSAYVKISRACITYLNIDLKGNYQ